MQTKIVEHAKWPHESVAEERSGIEMLLRSADVDSISYGDATTCINALRGLVQKEAEKIHYVIKSLEVKDGNFQIVLSEVNNDAEDMSFTTPYYASAESHFGRYFNDLSAEYHPGRGAYIGGMFIVGKSYNTRPGELVTNENDWLNIVNLLGLRNYDINLWVIRLISYGSNHDGSYIDIHIEAQWGSQKTIRLYSQ